MNDILKNLINADQKAQEIVAQSQAESEQKLAKAKSENDLAEERMHTRIKEMQQSYSEKAESKARNHLDEVVRLFQERQQHLLEVAEHRQQQAVNEVIDLVINIEP
ncbi:MAG: hypothetical protein HQL46_01395 [Gammaproteobacteria bacterium]|nr:hypothetical protein [Gammaproteobacteria bacterium]